jgi:hypothetical protein
MAAQRIEITLQTGGGGTVVIDGVDVSRAIRPGGVRIDSEANRLPVVSLELLAREVIVRLPNAARIEAERAADVIDALT